MSAQRVLRAYFHAKDENRPHLLAGVFARDARLEILNRSDRISFPAVTVGLDWIADVLVRRFNQTYENIYSFYMERPDDDAEAFSCDWLVGMTEKEQGASASAAAGHDWTFSSGPDFLATRLVITIEAMLALDASRTASVMGWLGQLAYPWTSTAEVMRTLSLGELAVLGEYLGRWSERTNRA